MIPPFLWFRARPKPPRSGVPDQATPALVPLNLDGYPTPQDPVQRLVSIATLDPPPDSILAGRISLHPDGNRLAVSFVRQDGKIYMLSETGEMFVFRAGREPEVIAQNTLPGRFIASPAISGARIYLRSDQTLFAVGN